MITHVYPFSLDSDLQPNWFGRSDFRPATPSYDYDYPPSLTDQSARPLSALLEDFVMSGTPKTPEPSVNPDYVGIDSLYGDDLPEVYQRIRKFDAERSEKASESKILEGLNKTSSDGDNASDNQSS